MHLRASRRLFVLLALLGSLDLLRTSELLLSVLSLFSLLSAGLFDLGCLAHPDQSVSGLKLLHRFDGIVDQGEACSLATTVLGTHAEDVDLVEVGLVDFGELLTEIVLGDIGSVWVEDITVRRLNVSKSFPTLLLILFQYEWEGGRNAFLLAQLSFCVYRSIVNCRCENLHYHLLSRQKSVCDEFAGSDGDWLVSVRWSSHDCDITTLVLTVRELSSLSSQLGDEVLSKDNLGVGESWH